MINLSAPTNSDRAESWAGDIMRARRAAEATYACCAYDNLPPEESILSAIEAGSVTNNCSVRGNWLLTTGVEGKIVSTGKTVGSSDESEASDGTGDIEEVTASRIR